MLGSGFIIHLYTATRTNWHSTRQVWPDMPYLAICNLKPHALYVCCNCLLSKRLLDCQACLIKIYTAWLIGVKEVAGKGAIRSLRSNTWSARLQAFLCLQGWRNHLQERTCLSVQSCDNVNRQQRACCKEVRLKSSFWLIQSNSWARPILWGCIPVTILIDQHLISDEISRLQALWI